LIFDDKCFQVGSAKAAPSERSAASELGELNHSLQMGLDLD